MHSTQNLHLTIKKQMKTNTFYLSLLFILSIFTQINTQNLHTFTGCIVDQNDQALIYADIKIDDNKTIQTDVDGCYHFDYEKDATLVKISYPGYLSKEKTINSSEEQKLVLHLWTAASSGSIEIIEREHAENHLLTGTVLAEDKEPLIGVTIQLADSPYGTVTDMDGHFKIYADEECGDLIFSYLGFETKNSRICSGATTEVFLNSESALLDEVVISEMSAGMVGKSKKRRFSKDAASAPMMAIDATEIADYAPAAVEMAPPPPPPSSPTSVMAEREEAPMSRTGADDDYKEIDKRDEALPDAGQLTAGEINDFSKWDMWEDISQEDLAEHRSVWKQFADHRYSVQLTTPAGLAVVNAQVQLNDGQGNVVWRARTNNNGQAELWAHYFLETERAANGLSITGTIGRKSFDIPNAKPFKDGINFHTITADCNEEPIIDIAFVIDATGSMGDEISYLQAELLNVIGRVSDSLPDADVQSASVFYKDKTDNYLTKIDGFSKDAASSVKFIQEQRAGGGGDFPEAVDDAMEDAVNKLEWRDEATTRLLFLVLDAPPHESENNIKRMQVAVTQAAKMGIQIIPVACSGINKSTEYLMRSMALATNGTYTFITDHSGIGNGHIEPSTDDYQVEFLNDVLVRLCVDRSRLQSCDDLPIAKIDTTPFTVDGGEESEEWSYYPNPTSGPLNLRFETNEGMLYLFDTYGKLLQRVTANERLELDLSGYPAGTYWLKHEATTGAWTQGQVLLVRR